MKISAYQSALNQELFTALKNKDVGAVRLAIAAGGDVNFRQENGSRPVLLAANTNGNQEIILELLQHGANPLAVNDKGWSALHYAVMCSGGSLEVVQILSEHGADLNAKNRQGRTGLHMSSSMDYADISTYLLAQGADVNARDVKGHTALHDACLHGHLSAALVLVAYGVDRGEEKSSSLTVTRALKMNELQACAAADIRDRALMLLEAGMDPTDRGEYSKTAIQLAKKDMLEMINAFTARKLAWSLINSSEEQAQPLERSL